LAHQYTAIIFQKRSLATAVCLESLAPEGQEREGDPATERETTAEHSRKTSVYAQRQRGFDWSQGPACASGAR
ncbi:unnamed protein product, partial [Pylaiella littoralis]